MRLLLSLKDVKIDWQAKQAEFGSAIEILTSYFVHFNSTNTRPQQSF
jgi:hypothetical protein